MINPIIYFGLNEEMRGNLYHMLGMKGGRRQSRYEKAMDQVKSGFGLVFLAVLLYIVGRFFVAF